MGPFAYYITHLGGEGGFGADARHSTISGGNNLNFFRTTDEI